MPTISIEHWFVIGLLALLVFRDSTPIFSAPLPEQVTEVNFEASAPAASSVQEQKSRYISPRFGFQFVSVSNYVIAESSLNLVNEPKVPLQILEVWKLENYRNRTELIETPSLIRVHIYDNLQQLPLKIWKGELSREDERPN